MRGGGYKNRELAMNPVLVLPRRTTIVNIKFTSPLVLVNLISDVGDSFIQPPLEDNLGNFLHSQLYFPIIPPEGVGCGEQLYV